MLPQVSHCSHRPFPLHDAFQIGARGKEAYDRGHHQRHQSGIQGVLILGGLVRLNPTGKITPK